MNLTTLVLMDSHRVAGVFRPQRQGLAAVYRVLAGVYHKRVLRVPPGTRPISGAICKGIGWIGNTEKSHPVGVGTPAAASRAAAKAAGKVLPRFFARPRMP
tara:strand:- start:595 stop:897 length:303 start_codon:yes stop_codon:yes gene_type:complete